MKINIDSNSKTDCCTGSPLNKDRSEKRCTKKCRDRAILYLSLAGIASLLAFVLGYYFPPSIIRVIWLFISATLLVLISTSFVVLVKCTKQVIDDSSLSEETN